MASMTAIGLMSGTSYDGIDIALIETNGEEIGRLGPTGYRPYSELEREQVRTACRQEHRGWRRNAHRNHCGGSRPLAQGVLAHSGQLDRGRRRHAQSDLDENADRAAGARAHRDRSQVGRSADALEAQAFGYLAVRTVKGLPITISGHDRSCAAARGRDPGGRDQSLKPRWACARS